jgi:transcriptional regulator with XRE-family HTH domain
MSKQNFSQNLRSLCNQHRSVAYVCRSLEINRQQFNKYLSGQVFPSKHNLSRICTFFQVSEDQLLFDISEFQSRTSSKSKPLSGSHRGRIDHIIDNLPVDLEALAEYAGYYYNHSHSLGFPGKIVRCLTHIYRDGDRFYSKTIEHLWDKENPEDRNIRFRYSGIVVYIAGRIFITEYEMLTRHNICHTILFPSYRNVIDNLSGLLCGVGSMNSHMPLSTRVEWTFLGKDIDKRKALTGCGLFNFDSDQINKKDKDRIHTEILPHEHMLTARD